MEIEEYRAQFIDQLRFDADHEGTEPETQFILKTLEELETIGELNDPMPMSIEIRGRRGRIMAFDAYAYDTHPFYFVNVDRTSKNIHVWRVDETPQVVDWVIPFEVS